MKVKEKMKEIENRGRTLDAVVNPKNYRPFMGIDDRNSFESAWKSNPDWIFANMAHADYCDQEGLKELFTKYGEIVNYAEILGEERYSRQMR